MKGGDLNMEKVYWKIAVTQRLSLSIISGPEWASWVLGATKVMVWLKENVVMED